MLNLSLEDIELLNLLFFGKNNNACICNKPEELKNSKTVFLNCSIPQNELENFDYIVDLGNHFAQNKDYITEKYSFINNTDGTIRWIFPKKVKTPCYLEFYNSEGWKAKAYKLATNFLFLIHKGSILQNGSFSLHKRKETQLNALTEIVEHDEFAIFTGTVGPFRKMQVVFRNDNETTYFVKIPVTDDASKCLENEYQQLQKALALKLTCTVCPKVIKLENDERVIYKSIKPKKISSTKGWTSAHYNTLDEIYNHTHKSEKIESLPFWSKSIEQLNSLKAIANFKFDNKILVGLETLISKTKSSKYVTTGMLHGDFTPWNMYTTKDKLNLYDWELSKDNMPLFFDAFHYIVQKEILIYHTSPKDIKVMLHNWMQSQDTLNLCINYNTEISVNYRLYLISTVCHYLELFQKQERLHTQVQWLINTWTYLIEEEC